MSRRQVNSRVDDPTKEAVQELQSDRGLEHESDAARLALRTGLAEHGYLSKGAPITPARRIARHVSVMLSYVAAVLMILTATTPLAFTLPAIGVFGGSMSVAAIDHWVLRAVEPAVTNRLPTLEVSRRGAR